MVSEPRLRLMRIFIASPGDVNLERDRVEIVIEELNRGIGEEEGIRLDSIRWEKYVSPLMGRPEEVVLNQVKATEWDVFIGILWLRFGTPTGGVGLESGESLRSGTQEEFELAYRSW